MRSYNFFPKSLIWSLLFFIVSCEKNSFVEHPITHSDVSELKGIVEEEKSQVDLVIEESISENEFILLNVKEKTYEILPIESLALQSVNTMPFTINHCFHVTNSSIAKIAIYTTDLSLPYLQATVNLPNVCLTNPILAIQAYPDEFFMSFKVQDLNFEPQPLAVIIEAEYNGFHASAAIRESSPFQYWKINETGFTYYEHPYESVTDIDCEDPCLVSYRVVEATGDGASVSIERIVDGGPSSESLELNESVLMEVNECFKQHIRTQGLEINETITLEVVRVCLTPGLDVETLQIVLENDGSQIATWKGVVFQIGDGQVIPLN